MAMWIDVIDLEWDAPMETSYLYDPSGSESCLV